MLKSLKNIRPLYLLPDEPLAAEVLIPGFQAAEKVCCMVGFFSSEVLGSLAPGLATYIANSGESFRLIISPLLRPEDKAAIEAGLRTPEQVAEKIFDNFLFTEDMLQQHTLKCLSWLLRHGRIEIRIALMKDALFHPKVWLFKDQDDVLAVHGSSNVTYAGIYKNIEQVAVSMSWYDPNQKYITDKFHQQFNRLWENMEVRCLVVSLPEAVKNRLLRTYNSNVPPKEDDLKGFCFPETNLSEDSGPYPLEPIPKNEFIIPEWLKYEDGPFQHQGRAVVAWCNAGYRGVLEMATGSGKTITAMICAYRLFEKHKPLLIVVVAPYIPLIQQWCDEIAPFGLRPVNLTLSAGVRGRAHELNRIKRRFRNGTSNVEIVVVSHRTLCDRMFKAELEKFDCIRLLIADEAHNLGAEGFISDPPSFFEYRLGLSATPIRQYDDLGTEALFSFFGPIVFQFTLEEAIGHCLVEYDYYVHPVELTHDEMDEWYDLTSKIKANVWRKEHGKPDDYLTKLFRDRRALLENAENKIAALDEALRNEDLRNLRYTLIYASDKSPKQLNAVNSLLKAHGVLFHQLTFEETAKREETTRIIRSFQEGS
jgi:hypothetical protein